MRLKLGYSYKHKHAIIAIITILIIVAIIFLFYKKFVSQKVGDINKTKVGFFSAAGTSLTAQQYSQLDMLLQNLNKSNYAIVYGGSKDGIMGQVGKSAIKNGLSLYAIDSSQFNESQYTQAHVTMYNTLIPRENALINNVDIAIILPGGYGTLMELFWLVSLNNVHQTNKKIIIWNIDGYYTTLIEFLESNKFQMGNNTSFRSNRIVVCDTYEEVLFNIKKYPNKITKNKN